MLLPISRLIKKLAKDVVAFVSISNLREYLQKSISVLSDDNTMKPIIIREILDNKTLTEENLKNTLNKLKRIIKRYGVQDRLPFQKTILEPIQNVFDEKRAFNPIGMNAIIRDKKEILSKKEKELVESKKIINEVSTIPFPTVLANK
jgi:hypothetical protein